jgi:hypothetical protein
MLETPNISAQTSNTENQSVTPQLPHPTSCPEKWWRYLRQTSKLATMDDSQKRKSRLELGHVLFIDTAGYSKLTTEEESETEIKSQLIVECSSFA